MFKCAVASGNGRPTKRRLAALGTALAATLGAVVIAGSPAQASGQNCDNNGNANLCINVNGFSNVIHQIVGSATTDSAYVGYGGVVSVGHVQVTDPNGKTLCNSGAKALTGAGVTMSCLWHGYGEKYPTGNYCVTLWSYDYEGPLWGSVYRQYGTECLNVFLS
jgi:hypothetical protein